MAITTARWITMAGVGCALIGIALLPPAGDPPIRMGVARPTAGGLLASELAREHAKLMVWRMRDAAERATRDRPGPTVWIDPTIHPDLREVFQSEIDERLADAIARIAPVSDEVKIVVAVASDSTFRVPGAPVRRFNRGELRYLFPAERTPPTCITLVQLRWVDIVGFTRTLERRGRIGSLLREADLLGPCAYYAAFGAPGGAVDTWYRQGGYSFGWLTDWEGVAPSPAPASPALTLLETSCAAGDAAQCHRYVRTPPNERSRTFVGRGPLADGITEAFALGWSRRPVRGGRELQMLGNVPYFLSDVVRTEGRAPFQQFWTSNADLETAFASTFGQPVGAYVADWASSLVDSPDGPTPRPLSAGVAMLLSVLAAAWAATYSNRRTIR